MANATKSTRQDIPTDMVTTSLDGADMYSVMAVLATMCNYNPVVFLKYPPNYVYSGIGITADSHNLSHRLDNAGMAGTCYPNSLTLLQTLDKYYVSKFAKLVGMLDGIKNADGSTLLDQERRGLVQRDVGRQCPQPEQPPDHPRGQPLNGYFKTGWAVNVDTGKHRIGDVDRAATANLSARMAPVTVNGTSQATGTDATMANGTHQQYFMEHHERSGRHGRRETDTRPRAAPHR